VERVILQDAARGVTITTSRAMLGSTTYAVPNITSVRQEVQRSGAGCLMVVAGVGLFLSIHALFRGTFWGYVSLLVGMGAAVLAYLRWRPTFWIVIGTAGAESRTISSKDGQWIIRVAAALNEAMIEASQRR